MKCFGCQEQWMLGECRIANFVSELWNPKPACGKNISQHIRGIHGMRRLQKPLGFLPSCHERAATFKTQPFDGQTTSTSSTSGTCGSFFANPYSPLVRHCAKEWRRPPDPARHTTALTHKIISVPPLLDGSGLDVHGWTNHRSQDQFQNTNSYCIVLWFRPRACTYGGGDSICQLARKTPAVFFQIQTEPIPGHTNNHTRTTCKACRNETSSIPSNKSYPAGPVMHNPCMETIYWIAPSRHDIRIQKIFITLVGMSNSCNSTYMYMQYAFRDCECTIISCKLGLGKHTFVCHINSPCIKKGLSIAS